MPKQEGQKSKLLALLRIFEQQTDENHLLNVPQLVELLEGLCRQGQVLAELLDLRLVFTCRDRAHVIAANRELLERLFWNLVSNAMKFTPPGGTIEVSLRTGPECVLLCVKDSGPGIPQDKLERLFDRWQHSNMALPVHGLGLGLPLCRRIAQGHGCLLYTSDAADD